MLASKSLRTDGETFTLTLSNPLRVLVGRSDLFSRVERADRYLSHGLLRVAKQSSLLVLISEAIRRAQGGGLDVPRDTQENSVLLRTP